MTRGAADWLRPLCWYCWLLVGVNGSHVVFQCCLSCRQAGGQQAEGRAGDVVQADFVAELDGLWIAAMLAANTNLQSRTRAATLGHCALHQLSHACLIERSKRVLLEDASLHVRRKEVVNVIARDAIRGLRQVVGSEAEELGFF